MTQMDVRLVTCSGCMPGGDYDSVHLLDALRDIGLRADFRAWDDSSTDWAEAKVTVVRSTWDYHHAVRRFLEWMDHAARLTRLYNPPPMLHWNVHKAYLTALEHDGVPIVPTIAVAPGRVRDGATTVRNAGWQDLVIKPAVSLDGHGVVRARAGSTEATAAIATICEATTAIIQPFLPEFVSGGELSLIFIDGVFAHSVRKRPAPGEFRVQERLGGTVEAAAAPDQALDLGRSVIGKLDQTPLYARVDVIESSLATDGEPFLLTELELVEPSLFLACSDNTAGLFARAIAARLQSETV